MLAALAIVGTTLAQAPQADPNLRLITNGQVTVGLKIDSGAAIAWLSAGNDAPNLVNAFDRGRLIQQSYYGAADGSTWNKQPWRWNPVQGGDWQGQSSQLLELQVDGTSAYAKTLPKHWATGEDVATTSMQQWIQLQGPMVKIRYRFEQHGGRDHPPQHQELPAVFVAPHLKNLVLYDGDQPWSGGPLTRWQPGWPNEYRRMTEHWAAYVNDQDEGIGVYVPVANELTCYRYGRDESAKDACAYLAPITTLAVTSDFTWEYEVYVCLGKLTNIRESFATLGTAKPIARQSASSEPAQ